MDYLSCQWFAGYFLNGNWTVTITKYPLNKSSQMVCEICHLDTSSLDSFGYKLRKTIRNMKITVECDR